MRQLSALAEPLPADDPVAAATTVNRAMETLILRAPQQYLWGYNRHKGPRQEADPRANA